MEDHAEDAVQHIEWDDFKKLKNNLNAESLRLDKKRNAGQSIQKDLVKVYGIIFDSVY